MFGKKKEKEIMRYENEKTEVNDGNRFKIYRNGLGKYNVRYNIGFRCIADKKIVYHSINETGKKLFELRTGNDYTYIGTIGHVYNEINDAVFDTLEEAKQWTEDYYKANDWKPVEC